MLKQSNSLKVSGKAFHKWFHAFIAYAICFGYIFCGRGFAGLHIPGIPIYIGEILLLSSFIYFFKIFTKYGINKFQILQVIVLTGFFCLFLKDILFYSGQDIISVIRDGATVYYIIFLLLFAGRMGYLSLINIFNILSKYHLLIGISLLLHTLLEPILSTLFIIGDDFYGLFLMPGCFVPPFSILLIVILIEKSNFMKIRKQEFLTIGLSLSAIILSQSRGGILGAVVAATFYLLFLVKDRLRFVTKIITGLCIVAVPAFVLLPFLHDFQENLFINSEYSVYHLYSQDLLFAKFKSLVDPEGNEYKSGTGDGRITWWKAVTKDNSASTANFIFGKGFGYNLGRAINYGKENTRGAHNAWVNIFGWSGLAGLTLYALSLFSAFRILVSARKKINKTNSVYIMMASNTAITFFIAFLTSTFFDNGLSNPVVAISLYVYVGSAISMVRVLQNQHIINVPSQKKLISP